MEQAFAAAKAKSSVKSEEEEEEEDHFRPFEPLRRRRTSSLQEHFKVKSKVKMHRLVAQKLSKKRRQQSQA